MSEPRADNAGAGTSAGALLRAAREKQGLHIAALAAAIKVTPRKLDALEHDRWDELPDATFTRALAQTVCRTLKIDARPVLDKLPPAAPQPLGPPNDAGLNTPFRDRPGREAPGLAASAVRPMIWGAGALMSAAVLVYLLPADLWSRISALSAAAPAAAPAVLVVPATRPASAAIAASASAWAASVAAQAVSAPAPEAAASAAVTAGETVFSAPPPALAVAATAATPVASAASGLVQLRTSEASWIEARDARGATLLSRTVLPGESVGLDGNLPIRMTIGNASATQLGFRGQPVDLVSRTRDNIARVELQ